MGKGLLCVALCVVVCHASVVPATSDDVTLIGLEAVDTTALRGLRRMSVDTREIESNVNASMCSQHRMSVVRHLSTTPSCPSLIHHLENSTSDTLDHEWVCGHTCWEDVLESYGGLKLLGCGGAEWEVLDKVCPSILHTTPCPKNCSDHGECIVDGKGGGYCVCDRGYGRKDPKEPVQDCSDNIMDMCGNGCHGRGLCKPTSNTTWSCSCDDGFTGPTCNIWNRCHELRYCNGRGVCSRPSSPKFCDCHAGYTGAECAHPHPGCKHQCSGRGSCENIDSDNPSSDPSDRTCMCDPGLGGPACNIVLGGCPNHCTGMGTCVNGSECDCVDGVEGEDCSLVVDQCGACAHGFCRGDKCECVAGYSGADCSEYDYESDTLCSALNFCSGGGVCVPDTIYDGQDSVDLAFPPTPPPNFKCVCFEGYKGDMCGEVDVNYPSLCPNHCSGNGRCVLGGNTHCECVAGWTGADCNTSLCAMGQGGVCSMSGVCVQSGDGAWGCECDDGFSHGSEEACEVNDALLVTRSASLVMKGEADQTSSAPVVPPPTAAAPASVADDVVVSIPKLVDVCEKGCGHGMCVKGVCQCEAGYEGSDCSLVAKSWAQTDDLDSLDLIELSSIVM